MGLHAGSHVVHLEQLGVFFDWGLVVVVEICTQCSFLLMVSCRDGMVSGKCFGVWVRVNMHMPHLSISSGREDVQHHLTYLLKKYDVNDIFLPHLRCISLQNRVISVVISMLLEVFAVFFIKIVLFIRWISGNPGKLPGAMTSPPAATAAPHRGSSAVNWLPWLLASRLNGSIEGDRWNWVGGWNSLAGGEVTALIFSLIFFCWLFNFWSTYPRILPWKETCSLKINGWKMYFLLK